MKYENRKNNRVATVVETDDRAKTTMLQFEDDNTTTVVSNSTLKRWWKPLKDSEEDTMATEEAVQEQGVLPENEVAGDGTPLADVGKEIAEQAKEKGKKEKRKKERKPKTPVFDSGELIQYIKEYTTGKGCTMVTRHKKDGSDMNKVAFKVGGHMLGTLTFSRSNVSVNVRPNVFSEEPTKKVDSLFGARYIFKEDTTETRELCVSIIDAAYDNQVEKNNTTKTKKTKKEAK